MPKFNSNSDYIPVSKEFIKKYMPPANGAYVKVYLYALCLADEKGDMTTKEIAKVLNLLESDVVNAFDFWQSEGALKYDAAADSVTFHGAAPLVNAPGNTKEETSSVPQKKDIKKIEEEINNNKALSDLCELSQELLGKTLKSHEIETLYWFYDELGLSPEVITMLLEYCVSKGKRNMNYIEKVAISWHENGIVTIDAADKYIREEKEKSGYLGALKKLFGFDDRNFSKTEETYLKSWKDEYGMDENMVGLAYEYCIDAIHKISFPYMDTIIKRWKEMGIDSIEAAEKDHEEFKTKKNKKDYNIFDDKKTDYDEIEKIIREKM